MPFGEGAVVTVTVREPSPATRSATAPAIARAAATKPATIETGAVVQVPLFVKEGEKIRVDTRTGEYVERVK